MQQVAFTTDLNVLKSLYDKLNLGEVRGANVVLFDGEKNVGICRMKIDGEVTIEELAILKEFDDFASRDFFFRTVLFKLSLGDYVVKIDKVDDRLKKFGFVENDGKMLVKSKNIIFPHSCGCKG